VVGRTIFGAVRRLSLIVPKRLFFAQNRDILLGENLSRRGLSDVIDFFDRSVEIRKFTYILVAQGKVEELMDTPNTHEICPTLRIEGLMRHQHQASRFPDVNLGDFLRFLAAEGQEPYCAVVKVEKNPTHVLRPRTPFDPAPEPLFNIKVAGAALFRGDKLVGFLNEDETRGLLWIQGRVRGGYLEVPSPVRKGKYVSLDILRSEARVVPEITGDGRLRVTVKIREEANLAETQGFIYLDRPEVVKRLEALQAKTIAREIHSAVRKAQEYKSDVFGFGAAFHRRYPREWRAMKATWNEEFFPLVEVRVVADAKIRRAGLRIEPPVVK